jgi:hypothetical protein
MLAHCFVGKSTAARDRLEIAKFSRGRVGSCDLTLAVVLTAECGAIVCATSHVRVVKSHIGRTLEKHLDVLFFYVEPLWLGYYAECQAAGRQPVISEASGECIHDRRSSAFAQACLCRNDWSISGDCWMTCCLSKNRRRR